MMGLRHSPPLIARTTNCRTYTGPVDTHRSSRAGRRGLELTDPMITFWFLDGIPAGKIKASAGDLEGGQA